MRINIKNVPFKNRNSDIKVFYNQANGKTKRQGTNKKCFDLRAKLIQYFFIYRL